MKPIKPNKLFSLGVALLLAITVWAENPIGAVDGYMGHEGSLQIWGWALDPDDGSQTLEVHVYVYKEGVADPVMGVPGTFAPLERPDLDGGEGTIGNKYGIMHGFDRCISTVGLEPGRYWINVWALNIGEGENVRLTSSRPEDNQTPDLYLDVYTPFTISYDVTGGLEAPASQLKGFKVDITLSDVIPLRPEYLFTGWNTAADGSGTAYAPGATYSGNENATLYAQWQFVGDLTVTLDRQGGEGGSEQCTATYSMMMPNIIIPGRNHYTFGGYFSEPEGKGTQYILADGEGACLWDIPVDTTLYAYWVPKLYAITYDLAGGSIETANPDSFTIESDTIVLNAPVREGYTFAGWTGSNDDEPQMEVIIPTGSSGDKSYLAHWTYIPVSCGFQWKGVPEGGIRGFITHTDTIAMPILSMTEDFTAALSEEYESIRFGTTDDSVLVMNGFDNYEFRRIGECDIYVVHDPSDRFAYDSAAFHVTIINPGGNCGESLTWEFDPVGGELFVRGTGAMADYTDSVPAPWDEYLLRIQSITLADSMTYIGNRAFANIHKSLLPAFRSVTIPALVTGIGTNAFYGLRQLKDLALSDSLKTLGDSAFANTGLTALDIPQGVASLPAKLCSRCDSLRTLMIPASVKAIAESAFDSCTALSAIYNYATAPQAFAEESHELKAFDGVDKSACYLYVAEESIPAYRAATVWCDFLHIETFPEPGPTALEEVQENRSQTTKMLRNGQLYLLYQGVVYTIQGTRVR